MMERYIEVSKLPNFEVTCSDGKKYVLLPFEHLFDIPAADVVPKSKWISVNDRLPEEKGELIMNGTIYVAYAHHFDGHVVILGVYRNRDDAIHACEEWEKDTDYCDWTDCESFEIQ